MLEKTGPEELVEGEVEVEGAGLAKFAEDHLPVLVLEGGIAELAD